MARRVVIVGSVVVHAAAIAGLIVYSFFHVDEVSPPPLSITFFSVMPPPAPALRRGTAHKDPGPSKPKPRVTPPQPTAIAQPVTPKPEEAKSSEVAVDKVSTDDGPVGDPKGSDRGSEFGKEGGLEDCPECTGVVVGVPRTAAPPPPPRKPWKNIPHELDLDEVLYRPDPHLPDVVKLQRKGTGESTFMAKICVDQEGIVERVDVLQGITGADEAIKGTVQQWRYKPQSIPVCFLARWVFTVE